MITLQELVIRGRFLFSNAPARLAVFEAIDGRRNTEEIASLMGRHTNNVRRDLSLLENAGLIQASIEDGEPKRKDNFPVYEKVPLAKTVPTRYFQEPTRIPKSATVKPTSTQNRQGSAKRPKQLKPPNEKEILDIARSGEDQIFEFKGQGTDIRRITHEIGAMLNTKQGGVILYGIDDDGTIEGSDVSRQTFDQPLQNSVRNSISPTATIHLSSVHVLGTEVLVIVVPPWDRQHVYQTNGKYLIRKGTNAFASTPEEVRSLHRGQYVI